MTDDPTGPQTAAAPMPLPLRGYRIGRDGTTPLEPAEPTAAPLPTGLIVQPGRYSFEGLTFDLTEPGVYRFYQVGGSSRQCLVTGSDLDSLLAVIGWLWCYGSVDDDPNRVSGLGGVETRPPFMGCGNLSFLASRILQLAGYQSRVAALMATRPWNGLDDGHTLVEIHDGNNWRAYDPSFHCLFASGGQWLSLDAFSRLLCEGGPYDLVRLSGSPSIGPFRGARGEDYSMWVAERYLSETALRRWYAGLAGAPLIFDGVWFVAPMDGMSVEARARFSPTYRLLSREDFLTAFYSPPTG